MGNLNWIAQIVGYSSDGIRELNKEKKSLCGKIADQFHEL